MHPPPVSGYSNSPLDESSDEIASLTEEEILRIRRERSAAGQVVQPAPVEEPGSASEDEILGALDDESQKIKVKVYKPGDSRESKAMGPLGSKEYEAYQLKMKAIAASAGGGPAQKAPVADDVARIALMFVFTAAKKAEAAWNALAEDVRKGAGKQVKEVSGVTQVNIGAFMPPRKVLDLIRGLKAAGGIFRTYKAEKAEVQKWLTEHLK